MIYRYSKQIEVADDATVRLKVVLPDAGTASHHIIDLPGDDDIEKTNDFDVPIGKGKKLKTERTIVTGKAANLDIANKFVKVNYYVNNILIVEHSNSKNDDNSPSIKLTLTFI